MAREGSDFECVDVGGFKVDATFFCNCIIKLWYWWLINVMGLIEICSTTPKANSITTKPAPIFTSPKKVPPYILPNNHHRMTNHHHLRQHICKSNSHPTLAIVPFPRNFKSSLLQKDSKGCRNFSLTTLSENRNYIRKSMISSRCPWIGPNFLLTWRIRWI